MKVFIYINIKCIIQKQYHKHYRKPINNIYQIIVAEKLEIRQKALTIFDFLFYFINFLF